MHGHLNVKFVLTVLVYAYCMSELHKSTCIVFRNKMEMNENRCIPDNLYSAWVEKDLLYDISMDLHNTEKLFRI